MHGSKRLGQCSSRAGLLVGRDQSFTLQDMRCRMKEEDNTRRRLWRLSFGAGIFSGHILARLTWKGSGVEKIMG